MNIKLSMDRMFPPPAPLSRPVKIDKEQLKGILYLPDIFSPTMKSGCYEDFMTQLKRVYGDISIKDLYKIIKNGLNFINSGRESRVYEIPHIEKYVMKVTSASKLKNLRAVSNQYYGHNFGQPVASNGKGIEILLRSSGKPLSVTNWVDYYCGKKRIKKEDGKNFLQMLGEMSSFPQESFDDLVKRIKFIYQKLHKSIDSVNPNNFLVDKKNKQINIVDLGVLPEGGEMLSNCDYTLINPLTDRCLSYDYMKVFNNEEKNLYINLVETIKQKCKIAYENNSLKISQ